MKVTVQPASQNTPILRRLLANVDMTRPASVPGGRLGRLSDAVVDEWIRSLFAMLTAIGSALWLMLVPGALVVK